MEFTLNGRPVSVEVRDGESLLDLLRERCGLTSMKDGCAPEGSCGACTVMVDGKAAVSCAQPAARVAGKSVTTLEGLPAERRTQWADSFVAAGPPPPQPREDPSPPPPATPARAPAYTKTSGAAQSPPAAGRGEPVPAPDW